MVCRLIIALVIKIWKHFKKVISNEVYCDYADMMNRNKPMELVTDHFKFSVAKAFTEHKYKYGIDRKKIEEYISLNNQL